MAGSMPHKHANCQARASGKDIQLRLKEAKGRELVFVKNPYYPLYSLVLGVGGGST